MAKAEFTAAWWKKNKASTLSDAGDSVEKALKSCEAARAKALSDCKPATAKAYMEALKGVDVAASALAKKANKTLHKETIGYLTDYQTQSDAKAKAVSKIIGEMGKIEKMTVLDAMKVKGFEAACKKLYSEENFMFLVAFAKVGRKANEKLYELFIKEKSQYELNIAASERKKITATGGPWDKAETEVIAMLRNNCLDPFRAELTTALGKTLP